MPDRRHREDGGVLNPIALLELKPKLKAHAAQGSVQLTANS